MKDTELKLLFRGVDEIIPKKEFHKNHPNFSFVKTNKKCNAVKKITVTSSKGIYKRKTNQNYSWVIFTSPSWEINTIN